MVGYWLTTLLILNAITSTNAKLKGKYKATLERRGCIEADFDDIEGTVQLRFTCGLPEPVVSNMMVLFGKNPYYITPTSDQTLADFLDNVMKKCTVGLRIRPDFEYSAKVNIVTVYNRKEKVEMKQGFCK